MSRKKGNFDLTRYLQDALIDEYAHSQKQKKKIYENLNSVKFAIKEQSDWEQHCELPDSSSFKLKNAQNKYEFYSSFDEEKSIKWAEEIERLQKNKEVL